MSEKKEKMKDSNELLNILMIILGILFLVKGVIEFLALVGIGVPPWLSDFLTNPEVAAALTSFGSQGLISIALGFWCLVAGIGMFREEEYALGIGLVVLSIMALTGVTSVIGWVTNPASFDLVYWPNYIILGAFIIGLLGFLWLLFTYKRYN
ncbi:MAG: hypothetical protein KGD74_01250 [Candidatus Lokiarchaeota archaeon]|nr:hypothetical protein [Candidatus Lokiarchaeota archaeon]